MIAWAALAVLLAALPIGGAAGLVHRVRRDRPVPYALALALVVGGLLAGAAASQARHAVVALTEVAPDAPVGPGGPGATGILVLVVVLAMVDEALKIAVVWPTVTFRRLDTPGLGVVFAVCAAAGFGAASALSYLLGAEPSALRAVRASAGLPAHLFSAGLWGYALGERVRSDRGWLGAAWSLAVVVHSVYDHIVFARGPGMLAAALPLLAVMGLVAWSALREIAPGTGTVGWIPPHLLPEPPSLRSVRRAILHSEQPLLLRWVAFGALVNVGAVIVCVAGAVLVARRFGIDIALADEADMRSNGPVVLLGTAILGAFPLAGYLVARASGARSVLEPAFAAGLAMAGTVALLTVTAPSAVIFALALAPVAFALSCGGAWFGIDS